MARNYSNTAVSTTLTAGISNSAVSLTVASVTGYPSAPFTIIIDPGTASEELCEVTNVSGSTFTVTRGIDGTPAISHSNGATVVHGASARDFSEPQDHIDASTNVHGVGSGAAVVGTTSTQTLTNKTLTSPTINSPTVSGGTFTSPTITGLTLSSPTITTPSITGGTLTSSTLVTPTIASFANAQHDHADAAGGGTISSGGGGSSSQVFLGGDTIGTPVSPSEGSYSTISGLSVAFTAPSSWPTGATKIAYAIYLEWSHSDTSDSGSLVRLRNGSTTLSPPGEVGFFADTGFFSATLLGSLLSTSTSHTITLQINPGIGDMTITNAHLTCFLV